MQITSSKNQPIACLIFLMIAFCCHTVAAAGMPQVKTDKDVYRAGETIRVNFSNAPGNNSDWICVVPEGSPDTEAGDYKYMPGGLSQGVLVFDLPSQGKYEVRAYYNYRRNGFVVSGRYAFSVVGSAPAAESKVASPAKTASSSEKLQPAEIPTVTVLPAGAARLSGSVFHFTPLSMDVSNYGIIVTNTMINAPKMQSSFVMLGRKDLEIFLAANNLQQNDQAANMIDIGTRLGLNFVIAGSIGKKGAMVVTNCKVVSVDQKKVIFSNQFISVGEADLTSNTIKAVDAIAEAILRSAY